MKFRIQKSRRRTFSTASVVACLLLPWMLGSCSGEKSKPKQDPEQYKEQLVDANKILVENEDKEIEDYIFRHNWKMTKSSTGLRYLIYYNGNGAAATDGKTVKIRFVVNLITGVEVYNSATDGEKEFLLGKAQVESGLEEGVKRMREGDKAKLIIPSHLAFGLLGDDNKIPKRATLIYDVELISVR